jgi:chitodextrinase
MGKARFFKIVWSVILLSLVMFLTGCGGGGGNSSVNPEEQTTISVTGKIVGSDNNPITGATVTITSDPVVVTTNQWGEFSAKVAPGEHTITVTKGNETLYRSTFTAQEGSHVTLGSIVPNYPDSSGDTQAPTVPGSATATAASSTQINLSWNASTDNVGVTGYKLYRGGVFLKQVAGTSTTDTGLSANTPYCYTISAGDAAGNWSAQSSQSVQSCTTTQASIDTTPPTIISVSPLSNAVNVATTAPISAIFSESVDPSTVSGLSFAVYVGTTGILIPGNVTSNGATVVFTPIPDLAYGTSYRVTIRSGSSGIKDMAGNVLSSTYSWSFTTVYNQIYDLFIQFVEQPTDANYTSLMNAAGALGKTQEAYLYKALGELMDIYRSPVATQMMQDFGITVGLDSNFEQLSIQYTPAQLKTMVYNYLKLKLQNEAEHRYLINSKNLLVEMEQRLTRVDNLLAQADGINLTVNIDQGESVIFDSIDIKVMRAMTNLLKANFIYLQSIDLDIKNYTVTYNGSSRDIRDLMNEAVYDDTQSDAIMRELCTKADNVNLFTYSDRSRLTDFRNTLAYAFGHYGSAVNAIQGLTPEESEARFLNAFSLDSNFALESAKTVRDIMMPSILNCIDNPLAEEIISPRFEQTGQEYVDGGDGFYYLQKYYDIYLDHFCFDTTNTIYAYTINAYNLLSVNGSKTLRDMAVEADNFVRNTPQGTNYLPYRLYNSVIYLTGLVEKLWDDFFEMP